MNIPQLAAATAGDLDREAEQLSPPIEHEFVSDMMGETELSTEEMQQLRMPHDKSPSVGATHPLSTPSSSSSQPKPQPSKSQILALTIVRLQLIDNWDAHGTLCLGLMSENILRTTWSIEL